jgi:hypothetical protein
MQNYSLSVTDDINAQLPYPYLYRNAYLDNALLGVSAFLIFLNPLTLSFNDAMRPIIMQKLTNPLL